MAKKKNKPTSGACQIDYYRENPYDYFSKKLGIKAKRFVDDYGTIHRDRHPAIITYHENGVVQSETYYKLGQIHRVDGPAQTEYDETGQITQVRYYQDGRLFREHGPTGIGMYKGKIKREWYHFRDDEYGLVAEVEIAYEDNGKIACFKYDIKTGFTGVDSNLTKQQDYFSGCIHRTRQLVNKVFMCLANNAS